MHEEVEMLKAFRKFVQASIDANPDYDHMTEDKQLDFRMRLVDEFDQLYPDDNFPQAEP